MKPCKKIVFLYFKNILFSQIVTFNLNLFVFLQFVIFFYYIIIVVYLSHIHAVFVYFMICYVNYIMEFYACINLEVFTNFFIYNLF